MGNGPPTDLLDDEVAARRAEALDRVGANAGPTEDRVRADYFGASRTFVVALPDGESSITHRTLMEGEKRKYMNAVNRGLTLNRKTQDAKVSLAPGDDRLELFKLAIVDWDLFKEGKPFPFSQNALRNNALDNLPPEILDIVEADIRKHNTWLLDDISIEDIEEEIKNLTELRDKKVEEEEGKAGSSS